MLQQCAADMYLHAAMKDADVKRAIDLAQKAVDATLDLLLATGEVSKDVITPVTTEVSKMLNMLKDEDRVCDAVAPKALQTVARPQLAPAMPSRKYFAFLSLIEQCVDLFQNSMYHRSHFLESSADWGTGRYLKPPKTKSDVTHAQRFSESPLAWRAIPSKILRVKLGVQGWNDDATVTPFPLWFSPPLALLQHSRICERAIAVGELYRDKAKNAQVRHRVR